MKKIFLFALCAITAFSAFAEGFSIQQFNKIKATDLNTSYKYAYESEISSESNSIHMLYYFYYYLNNVNDQPTVAEILKVTEKFKVIKENHYLNALGIAYATANHIDQALNIYKKQPSQGMLARIRRVLINNKQYDKAYELANKYDISIGFDVAKSEKNYVKAWQYGVKVLTVVGGNVNVKKCTEIIFYMFRYKPASVTKEQQIEFLTKLSQIYPIPGTDFNQWKGFMGFVGFKYKQLTGKDIF